MLPTPRPTLFFLVSPPLPFNSIGLGASRIHNIPLHRNYHSDRFRGDSEPYNRYGPHLVAGGGGVGHATTVLSVRKNKKLVMIADGQISMGSSVIKSNAKKVRRLGASQDIIIGFAGATADALTLVGRLEGNLERYPGQLMRACVEMAKDWRTDKYLRRLEATMLVADKNVSLTLTGVGDVLEHAEGVMSIGSGSGFALAAARALIDFPDLSAEDIAKRAMDIAADICIFTNKNYTIEILDTTAD